MSAAWDSKRATVSVLLLEFERLSCDIADVSGGPRKLSNRGDSAQ
jgi:hypothetical protein